MFSDAIDEVDELLGQAEEAFKRLKVASNLAKTRLAWIDFITHCSVIYNKLEQGAKCNERSQVWFQRVRETRNEDELLRYVRFARNTYTHGLHKIVQDNARREVYLADPSKVHNPPSLIFTGPAEKAGAEFFLKIAHQETGEELPVYVQSPKPYLAITSVKDRKGRPVGIPTEHMGEPIEVDEPLGIATLALVYFTDLLKEARTYKAA